MVCDVHALVAVVNVAVLDAQLARVGVRDRQVVTLGEVLAEDRLFVDAVFGIFWFNKAQAALRAAEGAGVVDQHLNEEVALIAREFDAQCRVVIEQRRHDVA
jgi:hypothetical protein